MTVWSPGYPDFTPVVVPHKGGTIPFHFKTSIPPYCYDIVAGAWGTGEVLFGYFFIVAEGYFNDDWLRIRIDDEEIDTWRLYDIYYYNIRQKDVFPVYSLYYNTTAHKALFGISGGISFRDRFEILYFNESDEYIRDIEGFLFASIFTSYYPPEYET